MQHRRLVGLGTDSAVNSRPANHLLASLSAADFDLLAGKSKSNWSLQPKCRNSVPCCTEFFSRRNRYSGGGEIGFAVSNKVPANMAVQKHSAIANKRSLRRSIKRATGKPQLRAKTKPRQRTSAPRYYIVIVNERYYTYSIEGPLAKCEQWHAAAKAANSAGAQIGVYAPSPPLLSSDSARTWAQRNFSYPVFQTRGSILALS